uniref:Transporter n=1 Tax=Tetraodon nigroviridis TaxID=99883 RepID=H3BW84_TETNG
RGQWANKAEFLLAVAGQIIGLGNVWRFPYLCYKNGGGVFFIPYLLFLVASVHPSFCGVYLTSCALTGLGYASQVIILHGCVYYIVILAWALFYLLYSFQTELPWSHCNNTWNTETCILFSHQNQTGNSSLTKNATSPVIEFWEREVLNLSDNLDKLGPVSWKLALCLVAIWVICYFCVWKGVKSTGKVVYLTATFPYVMLFVLLMRGVTLPGAGQGIIYYLKPDIGRLADPQVWMDAGTQVFFSYGICLGSLTALGSYNKYNNDCYKDTFLLCLLNSSTSFMAGFAIFSVLGFMAEEQGMDISTVAQSGPGLAFIAYPRAVSMMPVPQLWAVCFFIMIIMLGLDTQFVSLEALMTSVTDLYPHLIRRGHRRKLLLLFICIACFLVGLVMVTPGGIYVFQVYDHYSCSGATLLLLSIFQSVAIGWIYGAERFTANIRHMTGKNPMFIFKLCWKYLTPAVCTATFLFSVINWSPLSLVRGLVAPAWATALGLILTFSSVSLLPIWAIYAFSVTPGTLRQRFQHLCRPAQDLPAVNLPAPCSPVLPLT